MEVEITHKFEKQLLKIGDKSVKLRVAKIIRQVMVAEGIQDILHLKKLAGFQYYYRIRVGDYRMGLKVEGDKIIFAAFDHRSAIYKYFP